jgi:hypothetical protein
LLWKKEMERKSKEKRNKKKMKEAVAPESNQERTMPLKQWLKSKRGMARMRAAVVGKRRSQAPRDESGTQTAR